MLCNPQKLSTNEKFRDGFFRTYFPHNGCMELWRRNDFDRSYPEFPTLQSFGVVDSPEQLYEKFGAELVADHRPLCVMLTHVQKEPGNRGQGGGWRWHKWGPYVGAGNPTAEYLDDEDGFGEGVWCYHVYVVDNLPLEATEASHA